MQPCENCHACTYPDRVAEARLTLPAHWIAELTADEAPDHVWLAALNQYHYHIEHGLPMPEFAEKKDDC